MDISRCRTPCQKSEDDVKKEISAVIRQITASVTFLPLLESACKDYILYMHLTKMSVKPWPLLSCAEAITISAVGVHFVVNYTAYTCKIVK